MTIVTLATVPAILALVNLAKGLGLSGKWSALVAFVLGVVFTVSDYMFAGGTVTQAGVYSAVVGGAILGLSASGLYDVASQFSTVQEVHVPDEVAEEPIDDDMDEEVIDEPVEDTQETDTV